MWEVLLEGALGFLALVAGDEPAHFPKARLLDRLTSCYPVPYLLGVTKHDLPLARGPEEVAEYFHLPPERVVGLCALRREEALRCLLPLLANPPEWALVR